MDEMNIIDRASGGGRLCMNKFSVAGCNKFNGFY